MTTNRNPNTISRKEFPRRYLHKASKSFITFYYDHALKIGYYAWIADFWDVLVKHAIVSGACPYEGSKNIHAHLTKESRPLTTPW